MANLITGGNDLFSAYVSGRESSSNRSFLAQQLSRASNVISERGRQFMERVKESFDAYDHDSVDRGLRAIKRRLDNRWSVDEISPMMTIGDLQNANPKTVRWMAANPRVRKAKQAGRCHGWADTYVDLEPGLWGERNTDWKRVMNGMAQTDDEGNTHFVTYFDAIDDGAEELTFTEQCEIQRGWQKTNDYLDANLDDPTDPNNGAL